MRVSLLEKEQHEQEMKQAQQRLVLGMAHDLRTPLATLLTDLELLKRQPSETDKLKYAERALIKTQEIRTLSDQLFEYFLASAEEPVLLEPCESAKYALGDYLSELYLYLSQEGFEVYAEELFSQEVKVRIHMEYMNRIINNIFSNIQKYADRQESIFFSTNRTDDYLVISFRNKIAAAPYSPSTGIGVKNIALMMQKMNGKMEQFADSNYYEIQLYFPICQVTVPPLNQPANTHHRPILSQLSLTRITHQVSRAFDLNFTSHFASIIHELKFQECPRHSFSLYRRTFLYYE